MSVAQTATYTSVNSTPHGILISSHRDARKMNSSPTEATTEKIKKLLEFHQQNAFQNFPEELKSFFVQNHQASSHISHIISRQQPSELDEKIRQWIAFSIVSLLIRNKQLINTMPKDSFEALTSTDGICVGMICQHVLKQLQAPHSAQLKTSSLPLKEPIVCKSLTSRAHPFNLTSENAMEHTSQARFFQALYDIGIKKNVSNFFMLPKQILKKYELNIKRSSDVNSYPIDALVDKLSALKNPSKEKNEYLLALGTLEGGHHSIHIQASAPYHFMDPVFGVVEFDNFENLVTGLTCYVHYVYNTDTYFFLAEISKMQNAQQSESNSAG